MIYIIDHQDSFTWNVVHQFAKFDKVICTNYYELNGNFDYAWYGSIALSIFAGLIHLPIVEKAIERTQPA